MTIERNRRNDETEQPDEGWFIDASVTDALLQAREEERFAAKRARQRGARLVFAAILVTALVVHTAIVIAFLYRDAHETARLAQAEETPVEVIVEKPPEPEKPIPPPPQPKPPEPEKPKPKEDLSPAMSAPRAPTEEKVKTETKEAKTAAPTQLATPTQGQQQAQPAAAPPEEKNAPAETKKDEALEEDKSKPNAEALDKASRKAAKVKQSKTKEAKAAPKHKKPTNAIASLMGAPQLDTSMQFAKPTPKSRVYGGTEDVRWMSMVEGMLEAKVTQLPRTAHWRDGGRVVIFFHVDVSGRVIAREIIMKSGYPDIDAIALRALNAAAPFPPPPPGLERGLYWQSKFDGQLPVIHVSKR